MSGRLCLDAPVQTAGKPIKPGALGGRARHNALDRVTVEDLVLLSRHITQMWCCHDVAKGPEWVIGSKRFDPEGIESRTGQRLALQCFNKSVFIHDRSTGRVNQPSCRLHPRAFVCTNEASGRIDKNEVDGETICLAEKLILGDKAGAERVGLPG